VLLRLTDGEPAPSAKPAADNNNDDDTTKRLGAFDAELNAEALRGALKKLIGKDGALVVEMFACRSQAQLHQIAVCFDNDGGGVGDLCGDPL
jgi:hypothetical protein